MALTKIRNAGMPAGSVLQVQSTQYDGTDTQAITATTATVISNLTVNITPSSTSSKILLLSTLMHEFSTGDHEVMFHFMRGATVIGANAAASPGNRIIGSSSAFVGYGAVDNGSTANGTYVQYIDSPATTSEITYGLGVTALTTRTLYINRTVTDTDNGSYERGLSSIIAIEIAG